VLGGLLDMRDDGPSAAGRGGAYVPVLEYVLKKDPSVIGKTIRLEGFSEREWRRLWGAEPSCVSGETEIMVNVVTSPHHLSDDGDGTHHRMTETFGRLAPGRRWIRRRRADIGASTMMRDHADAYSPNAKYAFSADVARPDQLGSEDDSAGADGGIGAGVYHRVFECGQFDSARSVRREGELAVRAALGASNSALRRTLLAESVLCARGSFAGSGDRGADGFGVASYASRYSVRALDLRWTSSMLWWVRDWR